MTPELILKLSLLLIPCLLSWIAASYYAFSSIVFLEQQKKAASHFKCFFFFYGFTFIIFALLEVTHHPITILLISVLYVISFYFLKLGFICRNGRDRKSETMLLREVQIATIAIIILNPILFYYVWESRLARTIVLILFALYFSITALNLINNPGKILSAGERATKVSLISSILFMEALIAVLVLFGETHIFFALLLVSQSVLVLLFFGATLIIFLSDASQRYKKESITDFLTGLYNRRYFHNRLKEIIVMAQRHLTPVTLIMMDLDHFKHINDTFGHDVGDTVLKHTSKIIKQSLRGSDIAARYGGEEFCIMLPNTSLQGAGLLAERIRENIKDHKFKCEQTTFNVTVSLGVTLIDINGNPDEVLAKADEALYCSKNNGRDQVTIISPV